MPAFPAYDGWADDTLRLPVAGREYEFRAPSARVALRVRRLFAEAATISDEQLAELIRSIVGDELFEQLHEELTEPQVARVTQTLLLWVGLGDEVARLFWLDETPGKARTRSTRTAKATTTRKPASTSRTTSRTTSGRSSPTKRSTGRRS